jgi:hypothetical protein
MCEMAADDERHFVVVRMTDEPDGIALLDTVDGRPRLAFVGRPLDGERDGVMDEDDLKSAISQAKGDSRECPRSRTAGWVGYGIG